MVYYNIKMYIISAMSSYFTTKKQDETITLTKKDDTKKDYTNSFKKKDNLKKKETLKKNKQQEVYLVINKNTQSPLGIYSSKELALNNGKSSTYNNCIVYKYIINDKCNFYINPIYEDK